MFLFIILGATHRQAPVGFAGLTVGVALTGFVYKALFEGRREPLVTGR